MTTLMMWSKHCFLGDQQPADEGVDFFDNFFRHFVFNGEFLFGKTESFRLRLGYNHLRRKELSLENQFSLSGFSFGVGFKVSKFNFRLRIFKFITLLLEPITSVFQRSSVDL